MRRGDTAAGAAGPAASGVTERGGGGANCFESLLDKTSGSMIPVTRDRQRVSIAISCFFLSHYNTISSQFFLKKYVILGKYMKKYETFYQILFKTFNLKVCIHAAQIQITYFSSLVLRSVNELLGVARRGLRSAALAMRRSIGSRSLSLRLDETCVMTARRGKRG